MITNGIIFKNFLIKKKFKQISKDLNHILKKKNQVIQSLSDNYKNSFDIKFSMFIKCLHGRIFLSFQSLLVTQ